MFFLLRPSGTSSKGGYDAAELSSFGGGARRAEEEVYQENLYLTSI